MTGRRGNSGCWNPSSLPTAPAHTPPHVLVLTQAPPQPPPPALSVSSCRTCQQQPPPKHVAGTHTHSRPRPLRRAVAGTASRRGTQSDVSDQRPRLEGRLTRGWGTTQRQAFGDKGMGDSVVLLLFGILAASEVCHATSNLFFLPKVHVMHLA